MRNLLFSLVANISGNTLSIKVTKDIFEISSQEKVEKYAAEYLNCPINCVATCIITISMFYWTKIRGTLYHGQLFINFQWVECKPGEQLTW